MSSEQSSFKQIKGDGDTLSGGETTTCKGNYRIAICRDGKYAVTLDTGKCRCR